MKTVKFLPLLLLLCQCATGSASEYPESQTAHSTGKASGTLTGNKLSGTLVGIVVNGSAGDQPLAHAEVVLRVKTSGPWAVLAEATSDDRGQFFFARLPLGKTIQYQAGANRDGVYHPGAAVSLTAEQPRARLTLTVYDVLERPSPLVARRHEMLLEPEPGALRVTETILVDNPSSKCYVGEPAPAGSEPVTLQLAIPPQFERTTFDQEFFGRRFRLDRDKLTTGVPWPPGERELKFTYILKSPAWQGHWQRTLDLPCADVRVCVRTATRNEVSCNLGQTSSRQTGELLFQNGGQLLAAGQTINIRFGALPVGWMHYGRWIAAAVLLVLIVAAGGAMIRQRRSVKILGRANQAPPFYLNNATGKKGNTARKTMEPRINTDKHG